MYVMGGKGEDDADSDCVYHFDSVHNSWSEKSSMPEQRCEFAACSVGSDIFVFGGHDGSEQPQATLRQRMEHF
jgi:N-acetylneuraminic acid mutarotase